MMSFTAASLSKPRRNLVVIGASAGGVAGLRSVVSQLPEKFPAAVLIVLHTGAHRSSLAQILDATGPNEARMATDGDQLEPGLILTAVPDHHLLVRDGAIHLTRGPREHHTRPAIDPLFRSAALWAGPRAIGVLLSGSNGDGTAGLQAIKACGGTAIVQDPAQAQEPAMPRSALDTVSIDHCLPVEQIAPTLVELAGRPASAAPPPPEALVREHAVSVAIGDPIRNLEAIGKPSTLSCPDCNGTLFELDGTLPQRYRCHTGHAYTIDTLRHTQSDATELALWSAIRALREKETLMRKLAELDLEAGDRQRAQASNAQADRLLEQVMALRRLIDGE
jgi:two-component system chemotaxis response regulator CheB